MISTKEILNQLAQFLIRHGKNSFPHPRAPTTKIQQARQKSYRLRPELASLKHFIFYNVVRNIRSLTASGKSTDSAIYDEFKNFPNTLSSLPGAGIISEIGDIHRIKDDDAIYKMAGRVWARHQTGKLEAQARWMIRSANRCYFVKATNTLRIHDASYRAFYEAKSKEAPKHEMSSVLTAGKLVRLAHGLLKCGQLYLPEKTVQRVGR